MSEQRKTERIFRRIAVRVRGEDETGKPFSEETTTMEINRDGARLALRNVPKCGARLELTNLTTNLKAASVVSSRCPQSYSGLPEWGVEFAAPAPDFWGIAFEENRQNQDLMVSALLLCKTCGRREMVNLSREQYAGLAEQYFLSRPCAACSFDTDWEVAARDEEEPQAAGAVPSDEGVTEDRRLARRLTLKAPILVTAPNGASELLDAQDLSRFGLSFISCLEVEPGDRVQVSVGHGVADSPSVRNCLVIWRRPRDRSGRYLYGVKFLDAK